MKSVRCIVSSFPLLALTLTAMVLAACVPAPESGKLQTDTQTITAGAESPTPARTLTATLKQVEIKKATSTTTLTPTSTPDLRLRPESWQHWPIIPDLSPAVFSIYQKGLEMGRDSHVFSVIGDCQSSPTYFLSIYDEGRYTLIDNQDHLQETIDWYAGSFSHRSITVKNGLTAPGALNPRWGDPEVCESLETPIACEIRLNNPSLVLISLGTNWHPSSSHEQYLAYLTEIIDICLENGVVPVISTKADNVEGDYGRNLAMAQVAYDYHLPLWNFWAAVEHLPNHGLDQTRNNEYLVHEGWDIRNLSALEMLDHLHKQLNEAYK